MKSNAWWWKVDSLETPQGGWADVQGSRWAIAYSTPLVQASTIIEGIGVSGGPDRRGSRGGRICFPFRSAASRVSLPTLHNDDEIAR